MTRLAGRIARGRHLTDGAAHVGGAAPALYMAAAWEIAGCKLSLAYSFPFSFSFPSAVTLSAFRDLLIQDPAGTLVSKKGHTLS